MIKAALLLMIVSFPAVAQYQCNDIDGNYVEVVIDDMRLYTKNGDDVATSFTLKDNSKHIVIDSAVANRVSKNSVEFLFEHECAHFSLGHHKNYRMYDTVSKVMMAEREADCKARRNFMNNHSEWELHNVLNELRTAQMTDVRKNRILKQCM